MIHGHILTRLHNFVLAASSTGQTAGGGLGAGAWIGIAVATFLLGIAIGIVVTLSVMK